MSCYEDHVLLAYLDGELKSEGMKIESHLQQCNRCQARLRTLADDVQYLEGVLAEHLEEVELDNTFKEESWIRLKFKLNTDHRPKTRQQTIKMRNNQLRLVAAVAVFLLLGSFSFGGVRRAVSDFLSVFRVERIETITISPQYMAQIDEAVQNGIESVDIKSLGTFRVNGSEETIRDCSLAQAEDSLGFTILKPDMAGYGEPQITLIKHASRSLTLNVPGINKLIRDLGGTRLLPQELDQQTIILSTPSQVFLNYQSPGLPPVSMVQMKSPEPVVPGNVNVEEVKDALLSLPFWPEGIRQQIAGIDDWRHIMAIPETANIQPVTVRGNQGIFWNDHEPSQYSSTTVLWSEKGITFSISGQLPLEKILEFAEGM